MALTQRLELRQGQTLVMTPQLQQAIKLLQMSNLELTAYVEAEIERNPLLELVETESGSAAADADGKPVDLPGAPGDPAAAERKPGSLDADLVYADASRAEAESRRPAPGPADSAVWSLGRSGQAPFDDDRLGLEATLSREATLAEHLTQQLNIAVVDPTQRLIGAHLIGMINDAGYLVGELAGVAATLGAPLEAVQRALATLHGFDPPGIGARDLKECLALQLQERDRFDPMMAALIDHLPLLAVRDFEALRRACGADMEELKEMVAEIRELNPKPGNAFGSVVVQPVVPDVFVREAQDGTWHVELNGETLPRVLVNNRYYASVARSAARSEDKVYLSECHANANWLVKSLSQRAKTILKVAHEIVRQQDAFLVLGVQHLKPLNLKTVAEAIGMHESTVSRVTSNKYIATPRGIFEMKYFFTSAIASAAGGESHSAEAVRHRIRDIIEGETAEGIVSDDMIVERLRAAGIEIARRTVAKYREAMGIPSSVQRRRERRIYA